MTVANFTCSFRQIVTPISSLSRTGGGVKCFAVFPLFVSIALGLINRMSYVVLLTAQVHDLSKIV
jgi:hypothetical protein